MSAVALISGTLFKDAEQRVSKAGNQFTTATLKAKDGEGWQYWRLTAFSTDAQAELLRLRATDAVSVQGVMKAELYRPEGGEPRVSLSMVVDQALAARPKPRQSKPKPKSVPSFAAPSNTPMASNEADGLNDDLPW